jgi:ferredoxin
MVELKRIQSLYFSPTGNTKKIVEAVTRGTGLLQATPIELTLPKQRDAWNGKIEGDLMIIGVPVYASTFPAVILPTLQRLEGTGRLAVPVAVCGNAKMGACLAELCGVLKKQGFTIPAAGNFVGQHSFMTDHCPLGNGRPDEKDLEKAHQFGEGIAVKVKEDPTDIVSTNQVPPDIIDIRCYVRGSYNAKGMYLPPIFYNTVKVSISEDDKRLCGKCRRCEEVCSTGAMKADLQIDNLTCTRCFACVYACPSGVLEKYVDHSADLIKWFNRQAKYRGEPLLFF